ncbi:hypothetical protein ScPMuIL_015299, partial [Solemya velum]
TMASDNQEVQLELQNLKDQLTERTNQLTIETARRCELEDQVRELNEIIAAQEGQRRNAAFPVPPSNLYPAWQIEFNIGPRGGIVGAPNGLTKAVQPCDDEDSHNHEFCFSNTRIESAKPTS